MPEGLSLNSHGLQKKPGMAAHTLVTTESKTLAAIAGPPPLSHKVLLPLKGINSVHTYEDLRDLKARFTLLAKSPTQMSKARGQGTRGRLRSCSGWKRNPNLTTCGRLIHLPPQQQLPGE